MPRLPEIGNVQLYPKRPLKQSDKTGYVLQFYCPIQGKRVRRSCGTRDRREANRIRRECSERLLNGEYVRSGGAITAQRAVTRNQVHAVLAAESEASGPSWQDCFDRYRKHYEPRSRSKSVEDAVSRLSLSERILEADRQERGLPEGGPIGEYLTLDALENLQERLLDGELCRYESRSPMTVNTTIGAVMAFARYCFRHGWIDSVPPLTKLNVDEVMKGRPITDEEFEALIKATPDAVGEQAAASWRFILRVLWESGFRIADCLDFSWDDDQHIHPIWPARAGDHPTILVPSTQKNGKAQEIPMLPGLGELLNTVPAAERTGWVVHPTSPVKGRSPFRPTAADLVRLTNNHTNIAIARACAVSEAAVRKWLKEAGLRNLSTHGKRGEEISAEDVAKLRQNAGRAPAALECAEGRRPTKDWVGRIISSIGKQADVIVQRADPARGKRLKYASAHDIRRGCAQRLINAGVSAETLKLVMRHKDFTTTERYYGATRQAQSAAREIHERVRRTDDRPEFVGRLVGRNEKAPQLSAEELRKLKALLDLL